LGQQPVLLHTRVFAESTLFRQISSDKMRENNELFLDTYLASAIIFGNVFTEQYLSWRRKTMQVSKKKEQKHIDKTMSWNDIAPYGSFAIFGPYPGHQVSECHAE
jgi:hypothetical protein